MADRLEDLFRKAEAAPRNGGRRLDELFRKAEGGQKATLARPGSIPDAPINEGHPELPSGTRHDLSNYAGGDPKVAIRHLNKLGFEAIDRGDWRFAIRKKGQRGPWYSLEPEGLDWQDPLDIAGGAFTATAQIAGAAVPGLLGAVTTGPGGLVAGAAGAAAGGAAAESILGGIGQARGIDRTLGEFGSAVGTEAALGAGGEIAGAALRPLWKGAKGLWRAAKGAKRGLEDVTGTTRHLAMRDVGDQIALRQAHIGQTLHDASPGLAAAQADKQAASGLRHQAQTDLRAAEAELRDRIAREAAEAEENAIREASERLNEAESKRVVGEDGGPTYKTVPPEPPTEPFEFKRQLSAGMRELPPPPGPEAIGAPRGPLALLPEPEVVDFAQQELADEAAGYRTFLGGKVGKRGEPRQMYGGADFLNPARIKASWLESHPRLVRDINRAWPGFLRSGVSKSMANRNSWFYHLFETDRAAYDAGWKIWRGVIGEEAERIVNEAAQEAATQAGGRSGEAAAAGFEQLRHTARRIRVGEPVDPALGQRLEDLVSARLDREALKTSRIAQAKEAIRNAQGLESAAKAELAKANFGRLKAEESLQPVRGEVRELRGLLAKLRADRPLIDSPNLVPRTILPFTIAKHFLGAAAKSRAIGPKLDFVKQKARALAARIPVPARKLARQVAIRQLVE